MPLALAQQPAAAVPAATPADYRLAAGDVIDVQVFEEPELHAAPRIAADGTATLQLVGDVKLAGLTLKGAAAAIEAAYRDGYLVKPSVTVVVLDRKRERFTLMGQVARPGAYYFPASGELTLLDAIGLAGGFTRLANEKVEITRANGSVLKLDAGNHTEAQKVKLLPGDTVKVIERRF